VSARNEFFAQVAPPLKAAGFTHTVDPRRTLAGTVLSSWLRSVSDGFGTLPACPHAAPGTPAMLHTDDPDPRVRCRECAQVMAGALADDGTCHLCGERPEPNVFREFVVEGAWQLVIVGNACRTCYADLERGRPKSGT
jgi:hypothetical protein